MQRTVALFAMYSLLLLPASLAAAESAELHVTCPPGVGVLLDGALLGVSSAAEHGLRRAGVAPGWHTVAVVAPGQSPRERFVHLAPGGALDVAFRPDAEPTSTCFYPGVPRPEEPAAQIRARLEAAGQWRANRVQGRTPPADPQVGDTWDWYIWNLAGPPTATLKPCTVRGMGAHSYVVVDDAEWNVSVDQADVERIVDYVENQSVGSFPDQGIWELDTSHFGQPPNPLDGLDRVFLLYYRFGISSDGYFWVYDQFPDGTQAYHSNEADVVYLATDNGNPGGDYMLAVAAHELQHLIHYNYDTNEDTWVEEGLSELAMWLFGNPDTISSFNASPDNSLTGWSSAWADYIQTYLWTLYAYERFGGQPTILSLVANPANGMAGYLSTLTGQGYPVTMEGVFGAWSVANYLDDPSVPDGQYGYLGETLPPFTPFRTHATYPASGTGSVQSWAADYIRLTGFYDGPSVAFNGADAAKFRVSLLARAAGRPTLVREVTLDAANDGALVLTEAYGYDEAIIAVANVSGVANASYSYTATTTAVLFADGFETGLTSAWSTTAP